MGTLAETAIIDYRLFFANQGKQTSDNVSVCSKQKEVFRFNFSFLASKRKLPFFC
jgi:hypothetical protein